MKRLNERCDKRRKLTSKDKEDIQKLVNQGYTDVELADKYGVVRTTIYFIRRKDKYEKCKEQNRATNLHRANPPKEVNTPYMQELRERHNTPCPS